MAPPLRRRAAAALIALVLAGSALGAASAQQADLDAARRLRAEAEALASDRRYGAAADRMAAAIEAFEVAGNAAERNEARVRLAGMLSTIGETEAASALHLEAVREDGVAPDVLIQHLTLLAIMLIETGDATGAEALLGRAERIAARAADEVAVARVADVRAILLLQEEAYEDAAAAATRAIEVFAARPGGMEAFPLARRAEAAFALGDFAAAERDLDAAMAAAEAAGHDLALAWSAFVATELALAQGRPEAARAAAATMLAATERFEARSGEDYFATPAKTAPMLKAHADAHAAVLDEGDLQAAYARAFDVMAEQYDLYRDSAIAVARARTDAALNERDLQIARQRMELAELREARRRAEVVTLACFAVLAAALAAVSAASLRRERRQRRALDALLTQRRTLLNELRHRVKNNLQSIRSYANMQARRMGPGQDVARQTLRDLIARVAMMERVHEALGGEGDADRVRLDELLTDVIQDTSDAFGGPAEIELALSPLAAPRGIAPSVGMVAAELTANAFKHALGSGGRLTATLTGEDGAAVLTIADDGPGLPRGAERGSGIGLGLVGDLADGLGGTITHGAAGTRGVRWILTFPLGEARAPDASLGTAALATG